MSGEGSIPAALVLSFLLVLARVSFALIMVPIPGIHGVPDAPKVVAGVAVTLALFPVWPAVPATVPLSLYARWLLSEVCFGLTVGLATAFLTEGFLVAGQMLGLQAGYSYASTIDPTTQNDSTVIQTAMQLCAGMLFFSAGLDREVIRIFARSLEVWTPGTFLITQPVWGIIGQLGSVMFSVGLRLALPVIALLLLLDFSLALLGRVSAQLQLLTLAFPLKMLAGLLTIGTLLGVFPLLFERSAQQTLAALARLVR